MQGADISSLKEIDAMSMSQFIIDGKRPDLKELLYGSGVIDILNDMLFRAVHTEDQSRVELLLDLGCNVNAKLKEVRTAISF